MPYYGRTIMGREGVALVAPHWPNQKVKAAAVMGAESHFCVGATHVYTDSEDEDVGLMQHNVDGSQIATLKPKIWTDSLDPAIYMPIARANVQLAYQKWNSPMRRPEGQPQKRLWQPWVAYTSGWATYPEAWVWSRVDPLTGKLTDQPHGPWKKSGRYLHQAIRAVANWHLLINGTFFEGEGGNPPGAAVAEAERLAEAFGVTKGDLTYDERHAVYWQYPPAPTEPPTDAAMGYPVKNDGR